MKEVIQAEHLCQRHSTLPDENQPTQIRVSLGMTEVTPIVFSAGNAKHQRRTQTEICFMQ
ncbi:hypothetical protein RE6C_03526 [Rhodopirellula europaea 6C]|uniref:Uncharacterized protein n=1 Tax=Rhodopirellula europaea 6C TaxID=1263867 RepID=M2ASP2_9BACT|nr:hypothetical protein RE6C_03526 [Rhodopirellula europaea 6C]